MNDRDIAELKSKGASQQFMQYVGFNSFARFMEKKIESLFTWVMVDVYCIPNRHVLLSESIGPCLRKLQDLDKEWTEKRDSNQQMLTDIDPDHIVNTSNDNVVIIPHYNGSTISPCCGKILLGSTQPCDGRQHPITGRYLWWRAFVDEVIIRLIAWHSLMNCMSSINGCSYKTSVKTSLSFLLMYYYHHLTSQFTW